jgi:hypothetical protein
MRNALILQAVFTCAVLLLLIPLKGEQKRREQDEMVMTQLAEEVPSVVV